MKKRVLLSIIFLLIIISLTIFISKATWQGSYYKHGQQGNEMYGRVFTTYNGCKEWALGKIVNSDDTANCSKNCHNSLEDGAPGSQRFRLGQDQICEVVVSNWAPLPGSYTFDNYKE